MGPRLLIVVVYYNFLTSFLPLLVKEKAEWCAKLLKCCYYLQICEVGGLCAISFVHNREHYRKQESWKTECILITFCLQLPMRRVLSCTWPPPMCHFWSFWRCITWFGHTLTPDRECRITKKYSFLPSQSSVLLWWDTFTTDTSFIVIPWVRKLHFRKYFHFCTAKFFNVQFWAKI